jgi:hypothetical protein
MTETPPPLEDRLRAHFADRAAREPLEEPDLDAVMAGRRLVALPPAAGRRRPPFRWMAVGGVAAACAVAAATLVALDAGRGRVDMAPPAHRPTTTTERHPSPAPGPTTSPPPPSAPGTTTAPDPAAPPPTTPGTAVSVSRGEVLGWWDGQGWVEPDPDRTAPVAGGEQYQIVHLGDTVTNATGSVLRTGCDIASDRPSAVDVGPPQTGSDRDSSPVAVTGVPDPRPRPVTVIDPSGATYRAAAAEVLAGLGIDDPQPAVRQVVRGDLAGDGTYEVFVVVERLTDPEGLIAGKGDYSVVFMRRMVAGELRTFVVAQSIADSGAGGTRFVQAHDLDALADLNGDGRMEVVVGYRYYEGAGTAVYEVAPNGGLVQVLHRGCGV